MTNYYSGRLLQNNIFFARNRSFNKT